jgi:hypothetical protein
MANTPNPNDNLGIIQKKGDHLTVAFTGAVLVLINCLGFVAPAYHASYTNVLFDIVNVVLTLAYFYFAYTLWVATFEDYRGWKTVGVIASIVAIVLWIAFWGAAVTTKHLNGF